MSRIFSEKRGFIINVHKYCIKSILTWRIITWLQWVSFWIKPEAAPARVTLGVTSLLTLSTQHAKSQASLPPVSYLKAVDAFMSACTVWVLDFSEDIRNKQKRSDRKSESELIVMLWTDHDLRSKAKNRSVTSMWSNQHNQKIATYNMLLFIDLFYLEISLSNTLTNPTTRCRLLKVITFKQLQPET